MKISVVVPVYNSAPYLEQCLGSILAQTYTNLEVVAVNDGSTDDSLKILHDLAEKDSRVVIISQNNSGVSSARNAGLQIATGEWISFIDSDDELEPDMYETLMDLTRKHEADIVHCGYKRICLDGTQKDVRGTGELIIQGSTEASRCMLTGKYFSCGLWNKLYRRELFEDVWFDTNLRINEDILVNVQVFCRAKTIVFLDVPKYHYFERAQSACNTTNLFRKGKDCVAAAEQILQVHKADALKDVCASRLRSALINRYRFYLLYGEEKCEEELKGIRQKMDILESEYKEQSNRQKWNYRFMRCLPRFYRLVYRIYDRIRKPNWDV